uniref:Uncharacterized protein n=1 Tax=Poecilia mexicana TaxID=48701 RepID=A0A3B3Z041_9TELE
LRFLCAQVDNWKTAKSIYEFSATDIDGNEVSLEKYSFYSKHCIASECVMKNVHRCVKRMTHNSGGDDQHRWL